MQSRYEEAKKMAEAWKANDLRNKLLCSVKN